MSLSKKEFDALRAHIARVRRNSSDTDELVQAAVHAALERDPRAKGESLLRLARDVLPELIVAEKNRLRRGGSVREPTTDQATLPPPVRRSKRKQYLPKGVMSVRDRTGVRVIPREVGDPPAADDHLAARRLAADVVAPILRGEAIQPGRRAALFEAHRLFFGAPPASAWATVLTDELQAARRALLTAREAAARCGELFPMETTISLAKLPAGHKRYPNLPTNFRVKARLVQRWTDGVRVAFDAVGEIEGETMVLGQVLGQWSTIAGETPISSPRPTALGLAPAVLLRAIARSARLGCSPPLPAYVLDSSLIALLIEHVGFDGGGRRRLSGASIERLLPKPMALARAVEEFGRRHSKRLSDREAAEARLGFGEIAAGIRARAQSA